MNTIQKSYNSIYESPSQVRTSFNDMVKSIRNGTHNTIVKSQNPIKHLWIKSEEYAEDIISDIKRNGHFDYCSNIRDFLESGLADDMYVKEGNKYYLVPSQFDDYNYQFRLWDGTLITNVYEKTPLRLSDIARAVSDTGYGFVVYKDATVEIDESYFSESNEILYYVYV